MDFSLDRKFLSEFDGWFIQAISPTQSSKSGGSITVYQDFIYSKPKPLFQGATYQGNKTFKVRIGKRKQFDAMEEDLLRSWLEGYVTYRPMTFIQNDLLNLTFNVIITDIETKFIGGKPAYMELDIQCDSPYAYEPQKTYEIPVGASTLINTSSETGYTMPSISFRNTVANGTVSISNDTDNGNEFVFTNAMQGEIIKVDMDRQIVTSSMRSNVLANCNKGWLYLIKGENHLYVDGSVSYFKISYANARKVL